MPLISLVLYLIVVGALLYVVSLLPIDGTIKRIINVIVVLVICLWLLQTLVPGAFTAFRIGGP